MRTLVIANGILAVKLALNVNDGEGIRYFLFLSYSQYPTFRNARRRRFQKAHKCNQIDTEVVITERSLQLCIGGQRHGLAIDLQSLESGWLSVILIFSSAGTRPTVVDILRGNHPGRHQYQLPPTTPRPLLETCPGFSIGPTHGSPYTRSLCGLYNSLSVCYNEGAWMKCRGLPSC